MSLTILSLGFAIEGASDLYSFLTHGQYRPGASILFALPVAMTVVGLLFVWIGRHEWNELHHQRVRHAHRAFALSILGGVVAGGVVGLLYVVPTLGVPLWAEILFGAGAGSLVLGTFVTYVLLVFHLVGRPSQAVLGASIAWSLLVSGLVGSVLAGHLGSIMDLARTHRSTVPGFVNPIDALASYLFVSYFLLFAAYFEAHLRVAGGPPSKGGPAAAG